jgi:hypothetical protein
MSCSGSASNSGSDVSKSSATGICGNSACTTPFTRRSTSCTLIEPEARQPVRRQQPVDQRLQPVGLADDHLRVLDQVRRVELALEQLRRAADAAERVLDLVREAADQLAVRLLLLVERSSRAILSSRSMWRNSTSIAPSSTSTGVAVHDRCSRALPLAPSSISCSV